MSSQAEPRARARAREAAPFRFSHETIREIDRAHERARDGQIALNTEWMKRAELEGHVSELHDHYPGFKLWMVPAEFVDRVGYHAAVVRG